MANVPISNFSTNWTSSGTEYNGIKLNVLDYGSTTSSKLINLQVDSSSRFTVTKAGQLTTNGITSSLFGTSSWAISASWPQAGITAIVGEDGLVFSSSNNIQLNLTI